MVVATWPFTTYINSYSNVEEIKKVLTKKKIVYIWADVVSIQLTSASRESRTIYVNARAVAQCARARSQWFLAYVDLCDCVCVSRDRMTEWLGWLAGYTCTHAIFKRVYGSNAIRRNKIMIIGRYQIPSYRHRHTAHGYYHTSRDACSVLRAFPSIWSLCACGVWLFQYFETRRFAKIPFFFAKI